jgi:maltooligosyltrehalose synthase
MQLMRRLLQVRGESAALFRDGDYTRLHFEGADAGRVVGFARSYKRQRVAIIVGRHFSAVTDGGRHWPRGFDVRVKDENLGGYHDVLGSRPTEGLFGPLPVTVLMR